MQTREAHKLSMNKYEKAEYYSNHTLLILHSNYCRACRSRESHRMLFASKSSSTEFSDSRSLYAQM